MPGSDLPLDRTAAGLSHHGGRLSEARRAFPDAPEPWIDLSTGINPHGYPVGDLPAAVWRRLPDPAHEAVLEAAARACYDVPDPAGVVAAPGTQALIQLLPRLRPARTVALWGFGYQEHATAWRAAGADVRVASALEALAGADVAVVVNPNNPDGRHAKPADLRALADALAERGGTLIVDEAFADVRPAQASLVPRLPAAGTLVLRSFGKFFGLGGLRLGFAIGDPTLCEVLRAALGPWAVSGPALAIGARALADRPWQEVMRERLEAESLRLDGLLTRAGFHVIGGTSLFRLARHAETAVIFQRLGQAGILTRPFAHEPSWLRFGLPGAESAWTRLARALTG